MAEPASPRAAEIVVRGARTHNLKSVDLVLPADCLVVVTGVSGSGKSSLAFDTIYAEGQRRYVESLSAYARQFLERMEKPDVDSIEGISPAIAIRQKNSVRNPRSTVGTTTEIQDYLRLLYARIGRTFCRSCGKEVVRESAEVVSSRLLSLPERTRLLIGFDLPVLEGPVNGETENDSADWDDEDAEGERAATAERPGSVEAVRSAVDTLRRKGFARLLLDGRAVRFEELDLGTAGAPGRDGVALAAAATLGVVVDRIHLNEGIRARLTDSIETAYGEGGGAAWAIELAEDGSAGRSHAFSERFECSTCGLAYEEPEPRLFSFNNPFGACPTCHGFGNVIELDLDLVVPDPSRSLSQNAVEPWTKPHYRAFQASMKRAARKAGVRLDIAWSDLTPDERRFVVEGDGEGFEGVRGFFDWLERKKYKVHVRVFLSRYRGYLTCPDCGGTRLRREAREVRVGRRSIDEVTALTVGEARAFFAGLEISERETAIAEKLLREIRKRLAYLGDVGLDYLTLDRLSSTLSGGEAQRINLATALGSALVGTLYVLDEPSIGLHPRDNQRLTGILLQLRDQGNTVLVVEHDADMMRVADHIVDLGLGAGEQGGRIVFSGSLEGLLQEPTSLTAKYLRGDLAIPVPSARRKGNGLVLRLRGAREHNLASIDVNIPLNTLTCVTGVSGSGKSTLVHDVIYPALKRKKGSWENRAGRFDALEGAEHLTDVILIDQAPIGRTPRSNPVTYLKAFDPIREIFASTKDARSRGLTASHFSFNVPGGRCEACEGEGQVRVEMQFLADVFVPCEVCDGTRFKQEVLEVHYRGRNVAEVLDLTVREALAFFGSSTRVTRKLHVLDEIGLGYLRLGQPATTLSGGEAQRIKIASHLASRGGDRLLYILDEPTTGLHFDDIAKLLAAFRKLLQAGHSLLVIEHNMDVIKTADHVIDLGPEGGASGGRVVAVGTPEQLAESPGSHTGRHLRDVLAVGRTHTWAGVGDGP